MVAKSTPSLLSSYQQKFIYVYCEFTAMTQGYSYHVPRFYTCKLSASMFHSTTQLPIVVQNFIPATYCHTTRHSDSSQYHQCRVEQRESNPIALYIGNAGPLILRTFVSTLNFMCSRRSSVGEYEPSGSEWSNSVPATSEATVLSFPKCARHLKGVAL